ncbi:MAG: hypothetical protein AAF959_25010 [Cyanobacteria bacterium P01_D01_bin.56]
MKKTSRLISLMMAMGISIAISSCGLLRLGKSAIKYGDDFGQFIDDIARIGGKNSDELGDIAKGANVAQELHKFIKEAGIRSKSRTKLKVITAIEDGNLNISKKSLWQVAYETSIEELNKIPKKIQNQQTLSNIGQEMADFISNQIEEEIDEEYDEEVVFID